MAIDIEQKDLDDARDAVVILSGSNLRQEKIFDVFTNWQSLKLRSVKRFLLTTSIVITFAYLTNINVTTLKILPAEVPDESQSTIFILLFVLIFISTMYYLYLKHHDWQIRKARIMSLETNIKSCIESRKILEEITSKYERITSVNHLIRFADMAERNPAIESLRIVKFYQSQIENKEKIYFKIQGLERLLLYFLIFLTLIFLLLSYYSIDFNMIFSSS